MQQIRRTYAVASALALLVAASAGCSGGAKTLNHREFIGQVNALCRATEAQTARLTPLRPNPTPTQAAAFTKQLLTILVPAATRLAALKAAPADIAVLDKNLLEPLRALDVARQMLVDNVQEANGNTATEEAALDYFTGSSTDTNQVAENGALTAFGLGTCDLMAGQPLSIPSTPSLPATPSLPSNPAPPPPVQRPFVARDAGFSAVFPVTPTRQESPLIESGIILQKIFYNAVTAHEDISVAYVLHPSAPTAADTPAVLVNSVKQAAAAIAGTITSMSPTTDLGSPAEDAVITTSGQVDHLRVVIVGRRFYALQGFTAVTTTTHPGYDQLLATFTAAAT